MKPSFEYKLLPVLAVLLAMISTMAASVTAQEEPSRQGSGFPEAGVHEVTLRLGVSGGVGAESRVSTSGVSAGSSGALATVQYDYWVEDEWAIGIAVGMIDADAEFSLGRRSASSSTATVAMISLGVTYRPTSLSPTPFLRPFVCVGAGPYVGSFAGYRVEGRYSGANTSTVFGARALVGVDFRLARRIKVGLAGGYHVIGSFTETIGQTMDYSRPEFSIAFGMGFGGG